MNIDKSLFNAEMSDVAKATEKLVASTFDHVFADQNCKVTIPFFVTLQKNETKRKALAWVTTNKVWHTNVNGADEELAYEMNIATETLNRPIEETVITICHEFIHLVAMETEVKDTSRGGHFHNKEFKALCEKYNIKCERADNSIGHSTHFPMSEQDVFIQNAFKLILQDMGDDVKLFTIKEDWDSYKKQKTNKTKKANNAITYSCKCGLSFKAKRAGMRIICADCTEKEKKNVFFLSEEEDVFVPANVEKPQEEEKPIVEEKPQEEKTVPIESVAKVEKPKAKKTTKANTSKAKTTTTKKPKVVKSKIDVDMVKAADSVVDSKALMVVES